MSVGLVTSIVTAPWYAGTYMFQGPEAAEEKLGYTVPGYPPRGDGEQPFAEIPNVEYGDYHALVIGINLYADHRDLQTAVSDADAVSSMLRDHYGFDVRTLVDVDRREILKAFRELRKTLDRKDNLLIYYAGHGYIDPGTDEGYWLPSSAAADDPTDWISNSDITTELKGIAAKHILVIADSCFSGSLSRKAWSQDSSRENVMSLVRRKARLVMTSGGVEPVSDSGEGDHSVFASSFLQALDENESFMEGSVLFSTVRRGVTAYSRQVPEYGPIQYMGHDGGDFIFVRADQGRPTD